MILITGSKGQLGMELRYLLDERNEEYVAVDVDEMDITNAEMVEKVFEEVNKSGKLMTDQIHRQNMDALSVWEKS